MGNTIIPIGKSLGIFHDEAGTFHHCELDLGSTVEELTVDELLVWASAHENPDVHYERRFDRAALNDVIKAKNETMFHDDRDRLITRLFDLGALVEVDFDNEALETILDAYKLMPLGRGFGNSEEKPSRYGVGYGQEPEVFMGLHAYYMWAFSHAEGSVWAACKQMSLENPKVTSKQVAEATADVIPVLVAADCAYLERL